MVILFNKNKGADIYPQPTNFMVHACQSGITALRHYGITANPYHPNTLTPQRLNALTP